jgi:hypothetical protein
MSELFWIFATVATVVFILMFAVRHRVLFWGWNFLIIVLVIYAGMFKLTGTPRDAWLFATIENVHGDVEVLYHTDAPKKFIYLLVRGDGAPYYLRLPWSEGLQQQIASADMAARERHTPLMVDIDRLSRGQLPTPGQSHSGHSSSEKHDQGHGDGSTADGKEGGERMFYPKPVAPDPLKTPVHTQIDVR